MEAMLFGHLKSVHAGVLLFLNTGILLITMNQMCLMTSGMLLDKVGNVFPKALSFLKFDKVSSQLVNDCNEVCSYMWVVVLEDGEEIKRDARFQVGFITWVLIDERQVWSCAC